MNRCPYCGEKILVGAEDCEHCGRQLKKKKSNPDEGSGLTDLKSWEGKTVPSWIMFLIVGVCLLCVYLMFTQGCDEEVAPEPVPFDGDPETRLVIPDSTDIA